jgi:hypothetical protein
MIIKLTKMTKEVVEVDVAFPIYREHDVSCDVNWESSIIYTKIDYVNGQFKSFSIHLSGSRNVEITVDKYVFDGSSPDYHLGKGEYASDQESFENALAETKRLLSDF